MKIPRPGTTAHKVIHSLYKTGPQSLQELVATLGLESIRAAQNVQWHYRLTVEGDKLSLPMSLRKFLDDMSKPADPVYIVPARVTNVFSKEMKGYTAMLCANRDLREMPCKASGTSMNLYRGL